MQKQPERTGPAAALAFAWGQYRLWAHTSRKLKAELTRWRIVMLALIVLGAVLGLASSQLAEGFGGGWLSKLVGVLSALAIALATYFGRTALRPESERHWVTARSTAEGCKSESFKFATGTAPYDGPDASEKLFSEIQSLETTMEGVPGVAISEDQRQQGCPPPSLSAQDYLQRRVRDQIDNYYDPQTRKNLTYMERGKWATWAFGALGVVFATLGSVLDLYALTAWAAVTANLTAAVTSFLFAGRYQYLTVSYRVTADRLRALEAGWYSQDSEQPEDFHDFVRRCEEVISIENKRWLAEWTKKKTGKAASSHTAGGLSP